MIYLGSLTSDTSKGAYKLKVENLKDGVFGWSGGFFGLLIDHVSIATTEVYACIDTEQRCKVLENAYEKVGLTNSTDILSWEKGPK